MIRIQSDIATEVASINHQEGTRNLAMSRDKADPVLGRTSHSRLVHCLHPRLGWLEHRISQSPMPGLVDVAGCRPPGFQTHQQT